MRAWALLAGVAMLTLVACDYPRPPPVGDLDDATVDAELGDGVEADAAIDTPPGTIDAPDGSPIDAPIDAILIDAVPIDGPGTITVSLSPPTTATTLGTTRQFTGSVDSADGYRGDVALALPGLPAGWTVTMPSTITLISAHHSVTITITVPSDGAAFAGPLTLTATATGQGARTTSVGFTVANEYLISIPPGTGSGAHWGALTSTTVQLRNGSTFTIRNDDSVTHQIHTGGGVAGLVHQAAAMAAGSSYSVTLGSTGTDTIYCHVHNQSTGQFNVNVH